MSNAFGNGAAVAGKDFRFDGKEYKAGEPFPWKKLGKNPDGNACRLDEMTMRGLWAAGCVAFPDRVDKHGRAIAVQAE